MIKKIISMITIISVTIMITACSANKNSLNYSNRDIFAMDTYMSLKAYGKNSENALGDAVNEIQRLEKILSVTYEKSDVFEINNNKISSTVSDDTLKIIQTAVDIGSKTDGNLDITIYPVLKEWGFTTGNYKIPDRNTINKLIENVDYKKILIDENKISIPDNFQIDLGALAKGYTSDRIMKIFREKEIESAIISLGGNVQTMGKKPDGSLWKVGVVNPFSPESSMGILEITDKAVITSGNYERYFTGEDGKKYCHIIDPSNGFPAENGLVSVTVISEDGLMCDALSTALFVSGPEKSIEYWRQYNNFDMILVTDNKKIYITEGIENCFENTSNMNMETIYYEP